LAIENSNSLVAQIKKQNFIQAYEFARYLDLPRLNDACVTFFMNLLDANEPVNDLMEASTDIQAQLTTLGPLWKGLKAAKPTKSLHKDWKYSISQGHLDLSGQSILDVSWLTNALNSGALWSLNSLRLSSCKLASFPVHLKFPLKLQTLDLSDNLLADVDSVLMALKNGNIPHLTALSVSNNKLESFPIELLEIHPLDTIYISGNKINDWSFLLKALEFLPKLTSLHTTSGAIPQEILDQLKKKSPSLFVKLVPSRTQKKATSKNRK
jgi:Leucine-rich repeat (LRR) protein